MKEIIISEEDLELKELRTILNKDEINGGYWFELDDIIKKIKEKSKIREIITEQEIEELNTLWEVEDFAAFEIKFKKHIKKLRGN